MGETRFIVHLGFPKAASTSLQFDLFARLEKTEGARLETWRKDDGMENHDLRPSSLLFLGNELLSRHSEVAHGVLNILSDESFTAPLRLRRNNFGIEARDPISFPQQISDQVRRVAPPGTNLECLIVLRAQADLLYSQYVEEYNLKTYKGVDILYDKKGSMSLEGYEIYNFGRYFMELSRVFGLKNVHVLFFEDLIYAPEDFYRQLAALLGTDADLVRSSLSSNPRNKKKREPAGYVTESLGITIPYFTEIQVRQIKDHFREGNLILGEAIGVQSKMQKYGYL